MSISRRSMLALSGGAAAALGLPNSRRLIVISVHFKCCGYAGSREDRRRVGQAQQLVRRIRDLRDGEFGQHLKRLGKR